MAAPTVGGIVTWLPSEPPMPLPAGEVDGIGPPYSTSSTCFGVVPKAFCAKAASVN